MATVLDIILKKIDDERKNYINIISSGTLKTMEEYKSACGKIHGLNQAESIIRDGFGLSPLR